jgi:dienelactone hydrolase
MICWRPWLPVLCCIALALVLAGILLAIPGKQSIEPTGPFDVEKHEQMVTTAQGNYRVILWQPSRSVTSSEPFVLYAPGWGERADDSAALLSDLASHGYMAAAFDDIAHDSCSAGEPPQDCTVRFSEFSAQSPADYRRAFAMASRRVDLAARKGTAVLDALLATPDLAGRIDRDRIGAVGFSFGGSTAVEQSLDDKRIKAVVNLNGWLFGKSTTVPVTIPYLLFYIDDDFSPAAVATAEDPALRAQAIGSAIDLNAHRRLLARTDFYWLHAHGVYHADLNDRALRIPWRRRLGLAPAPNVDIRQFKAAQFTIVRAFLDRYLCGQVSAFPPNIRIYPSGMTDVRAELD